MPEPKPVPVPDDTLTDPFEARDPWERSEALDKYKFVASEEISLDAYVDNLIDAAREDISDENR